MRKHILRKLLAGVMAATVCITSVCSNVGGIALADAKADKGNTTTQAQVTAIPEEEYDGYLFAYFTGKSEEIRFALSPDGYHYTPLNENNPVVSHLKGTTGARDPYIIRGKDGYAYLIATDLKVSTAGSPWGKNTSIVTWRSKDLINWEDETIIPIRGEYECTSHENQYKVWAPEAIYDEKKGEYMLFWSMEGGELGDELMLWYAYTEDFQTLTTTPEPLFIPGTNTGGLELPAVGGDHHCIDGNIMEHDGQYYLFYKYGSGNSAGTQLAVADDITGPYLPVNESNPNKLMSPAYVEGADTYKLIGQDKWVMIYDFNWDKHYGVSESTDLMNWTQLENEGQDFYLNFGGSNTDNNPKHGYVIPITESEYEDLYNEWGTYEDIGEDDAVEGTIQDIDVVGAQIITKKIDESAHTIDLYISRNGSARKNLERAQVDFTLYTGSVMDIDNKSFLNIVEGAKVNIDSGYSNEEEEWTIRGILCNSPVLDGLYADPDIDIFNGKYYIYPTTDGYTGWNTQKFHVFSSENMIDWVDEGVILDLSAGDVEWADTTNCYAWAPSIERKDDQYYFYFCGRDKATNKQAIGVAVADSPEGPFVAEPEPLMTVEMCKAAGGSLSQTIDPSIYTDEETGESYMLFGNGSNGHNIVKLNDDMISWDPETMHHYPNGIFPSFREAVTVVKRDGKYHFTWSCNDTGEDTYSINYAVADELYATKAESKGTILYKVPEDDLLGTGHHSMVKNPGTDEYFIAYARFGTPLANYPGDKNVKGCHRETCVQMLEFDEDGYIKKITPSLEGIQEPIYANTVREYRAGSGGKLTGPTLQYVPYGTTAKTVTAVAEPGKIFDRWSDGVRTASRTDENVDEDIYVVAIFRDRTAADDATDPNNPANQTKPTTAPTVPITPTVQNVAVTGLAFANAKLSVNVGKQFTSKLTVSPSNATNQSIVYTSSAANIVSVDSATGAMKALKPGTAVITATAKNDSNVKAALTVQVKLGKVKLTKVINKKKLSAQIKWNKVAGATGYEIYISQKKNKGYKKTGTVNKGKTITFTKKKLKKGKKYYFKVRAFAKVNGKKVTGAYSTPKQVKIKK